MLGPISAASHSPHLLSLTKYGVTAQDFCMGSSIGQCPGDSHRCLPSLVVYVSLQISRRTCVFPILFLKSPSLSRSERQGGPERVHSTFLLTQSPSIWIRPFLLFPFIQRPTDPQRNPTTGAARHSPRKDAPSALYRADSLPYKTLTAEQ